MIRHPRGKAKMPYKVVAISSNGFIIHKDQLWDIIKISSSVRLSCKACSESIANDVERRQRNGV